LNAAWRLWEKNRGLGKNWPIMACTRKGNILDGIEARWGQEARGGGKKLTRKGFPEQDRRRPGGKLLA